MTDYQKKNTRNGNDKRYDRNRKHYNNSHYNNPQYINQQYMNNSQYRGMDKPMNRQNPNRKQPDDMSNLIFLMEEALPEIKVYLENMAKNQTRIADAEERKADAEERKANAMELIARKLVDAEVPAPVQVVETIAPEKTVEKAELPPVEEKEEKKVAKQAFDRKKIIKLINKMRKKGATYDQIATHLEDENISTFSGKGRWHAQTVHKFCQSAK